MFGLLLFNELLWYGKVILSALALILLHYVSASALHCLWIEGSWSHNGWVNLYIFVSLINETAWRWADIDIAMIVAATIALVVAFGCGYFFCRR